MPMRKRKRVVRRRRMKGAGFFGDLWSGVKKVGGFIKDNKLLSKGLNAIGQSGLANTAGSIGLGRRRRVGRPRVRRSMRGAGFLDKLKKVAVGVGKFVKDNKLASKALTAMGQDKLAGYAAQAGLGRKRRVRRRMRGGMAFSTLPRSSGQFAF